MRGVKEPLVDVPRLEELPEQVQKPPVPDSPPHGFHEQSVMYGVEVTRQIPFDYPSGAASSVSVLKLQFYGPYGLMHTSSGPESVGQVVEVALLYGVHRHEHGSLHDSILERRYPQRSEFAVGLPDVDAPYGLRFVRARSEFFPDGSREFRDVVFHVDSRHPVDSRRCRSPGSEGSAYRLFQPYRVGDDSQQPVEPSRLVLFGPCR